MGITFYGKNGKGFDRNVAAGDFLAKITYGLFPLIGCYPKSEEDCKLVARILKNYTNLNQYWRPYNLLTYGVKKEPKESIDWMLELAEFFDTCGGCYTEDEYYDNKMEDYYCKICLKKIKGRDLIIWNNGVHCKSCYKVEIKQLEKLLEAEKEK